MKIVCLLVLIQWSLILHGQISLDDSFADCHMIFVSDQTSTLGVCFQRSSNKHHSIKLKDAATFCSSHYSPDGHWIDLASLPSESIDVLFQTLPKLFSQSHIELDRSEKNLQLTIAGHENSLIPRQYWCPSSCSTNNEEKNYLIFKTQCRSHNLTRPCLTTENAPANFTAFICAFNRRIQEKKLIIPEGFTSIVPQYSNETILFYDSKSCLIVRTRTHQYSFCFRRQTCSNSHTSAFCTTKTLAQVVCQTEKNRSNLLTIENDDEYRLINEIVSKYSKETMLNIHGRLTSKHIVRAQWMWINGIRDTNGVYQWNSSDQILKPIVDHWWCDRMDNCSGSKGRDHVVLNVVCQTQDKHQQICLSSRRQSEPGPFICKRLLTDNEEPVSKYDFLHGQTTTISMPIVPVYDKNFTSIYYDENHCLTVQTETYLYTFCFRRQVCSKQRQAYCTKWSQAQQHCESLENRGHLLTIDNEQERQLVTDIIDEYSNETRLTYNGTSYRYYRHADYIWIDGVQQENNLTYRWKDEKELIPDYLWCTKTDCDPIGREHVTLNLLCKNNESLICLGTRIGWKLAPYACKRPRTLDHCPILFDRIQSIHKSEMLVVTINRSIALIKCKHPDYNTEIKVEYQCNKETSEWNLIYENPNFTCPNDEIPPMKILTHQSSSPISTSIETTTKSSENNCSETELAILVTRLQTKSSYLSEINLVSPNPSVYYDRRLVCNFNKSIQITYRCYRQNREWIYVHGYSRQFRQCYPLCSDEERDELLSKYFTVPQKSLIRTIRRQNESSSLRLRCFNHQTRRWNGVIYRCGRLTLHKSQWCRLHSCFQSASSNELPIITVLMNVTEISSGYSPPVVRRSQFEYQSGQYIVDQWGCPRKVCPATSQLCQTIRCPPDHTCRVVVCHECIETDYLQAVCDSMQKLSLCEMERQIASLQDEQAILRWEQQTVNLVRQYAQEQRQRLLSPRLVSTAN